MGYAFAAEPDHFAFLRAGRDLDFRVPFERRNRQLFAQGGLGDVEWDVQNQVVALAPHQERTAFPVDGLFVRGVDDDIQVPGHSSATCLIGRLALTREANLGTVFEPGRDRNLQALLPLDLAGAVTAGTGISVYPAFASACITDTDVDELAEYGLMGASKLAATATA